MSAGNPLALMQQMLSMEEAAKARAILLRNIGMDFVQRAMNRNQPSIQNADGTRSTHRMAWGEDGGRFWVFPTIVNYKGNLIQLPPQAAFAFAMQNREAIPFATAEEAEAFSKRGYKTGSGMQRPLP